MKTKIIYLAAGLVVGFLLCLATFNRYEFHAGPRNEGLYRCDNITGDIQSYHASGKWMNKSN